MRRKYPEKPDKVYFMGTCLADMLYAEAGFAGIRLLEREGVKVIYPRDQTCCGQPAFNSGFQEKALELSEFLHHVLKIRLKDQGVPVKVTWHKSCHAKRELGRYFGRIRWIQAAPKF